MRYLYGVFAGSRFALTWRKWEALACAKREQGEVRRVPDTPEVTAWDAPTFRACSDPVADFRPLDHADTWTCGACGGTFQKTSWYAETDRWMHWPAGRTAQHCRTAPTGLYLACPGYRCHTCDEIRHTTPGPLAIYTKKEG
jgi:hypothetical protein